jgi:hypothetical protein
MGIPIRPSVKVGYDVLHGSQIEKLVYCGKGSVYEQVGDNILGADTHRRSQFHHRHGTGWVQSCWLDNLSEILHPNQSIFRADAFVSLCCRYRDFRF